MSKKIYGIDNCPHDDLYYLTENNELYIHNNEYVRFDEWHKESLEAIVELLNSHAQCSHRKALEILIEEINHLKYIYLGDNGTIIHNTSINTKPHTGYSEQVRLLEQVQELLLLKLDDEKKGYD